MLALLLTSALVLYGTLAGSSAPAHTSTTRGTSALGITLLLDRLPSNAPCSQAFLSAAITNYRSKLITITQIPGDRLPPANFIVNATAGACRLHFLVLQGQGITSAQFAGDVTRYSNTPGILFRNTYVLQATSIPVTMTTASVVVQQCAQAYQVVTQASDTCQTPGTSSSTSWYSNLNPYLMDIAAITGMLIGSCIVVTVVTCRYARYTTLVSPNASGGPSNVQDPVKIVDPDLAQQQGSPMPIARVRTTNIRRYATADSDAARRPTPSSVPYFSQSVSDLKAPLPFELTNGAAAGPRVIRRGMSTSGKSKKHPLQYGDADTGRDAVQTIDD
ncbi:Uncharacterized protein PBTT_05640 [Plasmodiophora brassicae]|uniref:Uncharacterized protein n=1 Tax=Plasmodiophora brassicae TaxID=37360 RepID=A0A0G4IPY0_PLABS|nr:hypothetical protein PBRA_000605 [Plasmodiophora brassicae]SPQ97566.1 unnamed protein product [Plasmodiophora brassicae]